MKVPTRCRAGRRSQGEAPAASSSGLELSYPGVWSFLKGGGLVLLTSDQQLQDCARNPDLPIDRLSGTDEKISLREICRRIVRNGGRKVIVCYDFFFGGTERTLFPDEPVFRKMLKGIHDVAKSFGLGLEASVLSPLELGRGFEEQTGECGWWLEYQEGYRDPATGSFRVETDLQKQWFNNKGFVPFQLDHVRIFAFKEKRITHSALYEVRPKWIREVKTKVHIAEVTGSRGNVGSVKWSVDKHISVHAVITGQVDMRGGEEYDRVLAVLYYRVREMDYFSPRAKPFLFDHLAAFKEEGVAFAGFYSDEPHIQGDGCYFRHFGPRQLPVRYVSPWFEKAFAKEFGSQYADMAPWLVYFAQNQHGFIRSIDREYEAQHVMGHSPRDIARTMLLRQRYYSFLQDRVVNLFVNAKDHAEKLFGHAVETRAHATWAESPTLDVWTRSCEPVDRRNANYDYASDFLASNTAHQAASACYDYFRWNDFLTGMGNDVAEGGYADRNYYGRTLSCSTGILNEYPYAYYGFWGLPKKCTPFMNNVNDTFGASASYRTIFMQESQHRQVEPLFLYPLDLVAVDERFGSWMTQYAYANYISADKLLQHADIRNGVIHVKGRQFSTLVALYEPFPSLALIKFCQEFVRTGGRLIWSSVPPVLTRSGGKIPSTWAHLFGLADFPNRPDGEAFPGHCVQFESKLRGIASMPILTHLRVDRTFPVTPTRNAAVVARCNNRVVGVHRKHPGGGQAVYLGFRPRDDQSGTTGENVRWWFDILLALGAYPGSGRNAVNDNPSVISRTSPYLCCRFPNGTISLCRHYKDHAENWMYGFQRNDAEDETCLRKNPLPGQDIRLDRFPVAGHKVTYCGTGVLSFRFDGKRRLVGFCGQDTCGIQVDDQVWSFTNAPNDISFCPVPKAMLPCGVTRAVQVRADRPGRIAIPANAFDFIPTKAWLDEDGQGRSSREISFLFDRRRKAFTFKVTAADAGKWIYII